jgi:hypothetical protein
MPSPPTFTEAMRRVNDALPAGVEIAFRPRVAGGGRAPAPYRILVDGRQVAASASLEGAIFIAARHTRGRPQPSLAFAGEIHHG